MTQGAECLAEKLNNIVVMLIPCFGKDYIHCKNFT